MEKDLKIYQELSAAAVTVFNEGIDAPAGIYKLSELAKVGTTSKTAPKGVFFRSDYDTDKAITLSVEDFICSFPACQVFRLAHRFETLAQVAAKDRAIFTREAARGELVAVVSFGAATVEDLKACADKKSIRERMKGVFIDVAAGMSCCSDGRALNVSRLVHAQAFDLDALNYGGVILPRDFVKAAKGCEISIYKDNEEIIAVASNGATCNAIPGYYPNFKGVFSHVDASRAVRLKKNICALQKAAVTVAKTTNNNEVFVSGRNTDQFITVSANGEGGEISRLVALSSPLTFNFAIKCEATELKKINSAVNAFYIALSGNFAFIGKKTISGLCHHFFENATPTAEAAAQNADPGDCELNIFEAFAASVAPVAPAEVAVKEENIAASVAPFVPAEDAVKEENAATVAPVAPAEVAVKEENIAATVAPAEDAMKEGNNAATVAPVDPSEDAVKEGNNAASVTPVTPAEDAAKEDNNAAVAPWRSVCFKLLQVAAALFCFILCNISIKGDVAAVSLPNNDSFAPCADRAAARASPGATPDESDGSKQIPERADNTAAPDAMPP